MIDAYKQATVDQSEQETDAEECDKDSSEDADDKEVDSEVTKAKQEAADALAELKTVKALEIAGGKKEYSNLIKWAQQNLSDGQAAMYDAVMDSGNVVQVQFAVQALKVRFTLSQDSEGSFNTPGTENHSVVQGYESLSDFMDALADPRYEYDEDYRKQVDQKAILTNVLC